MRLLEMWLRTPGAAALGWTLIHSLWEGAVIALALCIALRFLRSANARYTAGCAAMLGLLGAVGCTFARMLPQQWLFPLAVSERTAGLPAVEGFDAQRVAETWLHGGASVYLPWLALFWMAGVLLFHLRSVTSWMATRRLCRTGVCSAPDWWQGRLDRLSSRLRLSRPVRLLESCLVEAPVVIGFFRPVILTPVGLLAGLPAGQVEAILLHELAHIRRHDYLVNLLQIFVEGLLFYHPAVWWISGVVRTERENCCDDLVVEIQGEAYEYASALAALEQSRSGASEALAATGGSLVKRIRRLLAQPERPSIGLAPALAAAVLTITVVTAVAAWQSKPASQAPAPKVETPYEKWLNEDVTYIITDDEKRAFNGLQTDEEREKFIEQFWLRRDPTPGTARNEFKEEHYRRIQFANARFTTSAVKGWSGDRGRIYILYGPPDEIESHPFGSPSEYPFDDWRYHHINGLGDNVDFEFVDKNWSGDYQLTTNPSEKYAPGGNPTTGSIASIGAAVQVVNGGALVSIPMASFIGHHVKLQGRVVIPGRNGSFWSLSFEDGFQGSAPAYTRFVKAGPGSYLLKLVIKDVTTGAVGSQDIPFDVK